MRRLLYRMTRVAPRDIVNLSPVRKSVERQFKVTSRLRLGVKAEGRGHGVWAARSHQDAGPAFRYPELCSEEQSRTSASMRRRCRASDVCRAVAHGVWEGQVAPWDSGGETQSGR